jgi:hypothetical protein
MNLRADVNMRFYWRFALFAIGGIGLALWFLYDGAIGWPQQRERALKYEELLNDDPSLQKWTEYAESKGWSTEGPGKPKDPVEIKLQFVWAGLAAIVGIVFTIVVLRARGRWIEVDNTSLRASWGQELQFDQIMRIDKRQWRKKGIARIWYQDNGRRRRFVIDDFKFVRRATDEILRYVESRISPERIVGGPPEPPADEMEEAASHAEG